MVIDSLVSGKMHDAAIWLDSFNEVIDYFSSNYSIHLSEVIDSWLSGILYDAAKVLDSLRKVIDYSCEKVLDSPRSSNRFFCLWILYDAAKVLDYFKEVLDYFWQFFSKTIFLSPELNSRFSKIDFPCNVKFENILENIERLKQKLLH